MSDTKYAIKRFIDELRNYARNMKNITSWFKRQLEIIYEMDNIITRDEAIELIKRVVNQYLEEVNKVRDKIEKVKNELGTTG